MLKILNISEFVAKLILSFWKYFSNSVSLKLDKKWANPFISINAVSLNLSLDLIY